MHEGAGPHPDDRSIVLYSGIYFGGGKDRTVVKYVVWKRLERKKLSIFYTSSIRKILFSCFDFTSTSPFQLSTVSFY